MNRSSYQTWSTLNRIKMFFGYRESIYQPVAKNEMDEMSSSMDVDTSCLNDKTSIIEDKSMLVHQFDNINIKQIQEILPLVNGQSFQLSELLPPRVSY
ncbi:hypothetical protein I4U23_009932 [Adineta vaga]|nr:hypothetical protein I4U23_009932 [Adineta vaga]